MTPERWQEIKVVLDDALELKASERAAFLDRVCARDASLRKEVEVLLSADEEAGPDFLNEPRRFEMTTVGGAAGNPDEPTDLWIGRRVGPYKVVERLGIGGFGEVYRAIRADDQYHKEVALKVVRAGQDSAFVFSRFKHERQILAGLDHPNIARLHDGGATEDGVPYFVMELIDGQPLDRYCENHRLSVTERLKLFLPVCAAVQYAHQRLIIHRDIKPGNILVTTDGVPKLLDFGIAKILDTGAEAGGPEPTLTVFRVLTPGYASPEQIKGEPITTASDVYSLGVVLYELLTGQHPYRRLSGKPEEMARAVCEEEPRKPSTVARKNTTKRTGSAGSSGLPEMIDVSAEKRSKRLRGDLDNIVLMALRKEPQRRYVSVEQFAEDIRRHLARLPVAARQDTIAYRTSKFIARHKTAVVAAVLLTLTLLAGLAITLREARLAREQAAIARAEKARAERRFNDVRKLANSLIFEVHDSIRNLPGATETRKLVLTRALEYLDSLSRESSGDPSLQRELATAYDRVGDVLGASANPNLGDFGGAIESYTKALAIWESLAEANPTDVDGQIGLAGEYFRITQVREDIGDFQGARETMRRAQPFIQRVATGQNDPKMQTQLAGLYYYTAGLLDKMGDFPGALQNYRQAAAILEPLAADPKSNLIVRAYLTGNYNGVARMLVETGHIDEGVAMAAKALAMLKQLSEANPANATLREYLAEGYGISSDIARKKGDLESALEFGRRSYEIFRELKLADPNNQLSATNTVLSQLSLGEILVLQGKIAEGARNIREALASFRATGGSKSVWEATARSSSYSDLGMTYAALAGRAVTTREKERYWREAKVSYQKGLIAWNGRPGHTTLTASGVDLAADLNSKIANCDANLIKLEARTRPPHP
jgi:serine/threonine protein kinase/tetratricopeptide (TPR) repeat protein